MTHRSGSSLCDMGWGLSATGLIPVRNSELKPACSVEILNP